MPDPLAPASPGYGLWDKPGYNVSSTIVSHMDPDGLYVVVATVGNDLDSWAYVVGRSAAGWKPCSRLEPVVRSRRTGA